MCCRKAQIPKLLYEPGNVLGVVAVALAAEGGLQVPAHCISRFVLSKNNSSNLCCFVCCVMWQQQHYHNNNSHDSGIKQYTNSSNTSGIEHYHLQGMLTL